MVKVMTLPCSMTSLKPAAENFAEPIGTAQPGPCGARATKDIDSRLLQNMLRQGVLGDQHHNKTTLQRYFQDCMVGQSLAGIGRHLGSHRAATTINKVNPMRLCVEQQSAT